MGQAMSEALVAVCRAGASTIAEIKRVGLPAVLVPFAAAAHDHQTFNARSLVKLGAALLLPEADLPGATSLFKKVLKNRGELERMAAAHGDAGPDSAALCAEVVLALQERTEVTQIVQKYGAHVS
jgi:UDP-N-acetylglucosamine--N-acetylmuramyl-(pentapeptide) pyrophosphoryl-undecaprenol N-acetylglucosamine transferase